MKCVYFLGQYRHFYISHINNKNVYNTFVVHDIIFRNFDKKLSKMLTSQIGPRDVMEKGGGVYNGGS